jgi:acyl-CoA dehydrogenase
MSIVLPFLLVLLVARIASYHRFSLAVFAALAATVWSPRSWAAPTPPAVIVCAALLAVFVLPLLIPPLRQAWSPSSCCASTPRSCRTLSDHRARGAGKRARSASEGRAVLRRPQWDVLLSQPKPVLTPRSRPSSTARRGSLPHVQRLGNHAHPPGPGAGDVGVPQEEQVLRD